jgi:hypothetical protein
MTGYFYVTNNSKSLFSTRWPRENFVVVTGNVKIRDSIALAYLYFTVVSPEIDVVGWLA